MSPGRRIERLRRDHAVEAFDCGKPALKSYLVRHALQNQRAGGAVTYLALEGDEVAGFHSLAYGQVEYADAPERLTRGLAHHPVPVMLLTRLAVDRRFHGQGLGAGLLKDAMLRTLQAAEIAGLRAIIVHAKDDEARAFYEHFDFAPSPSDPHHLMVLLKEVRSLVGR